MKRLLCIIVICAMLCGCGKEESKYDRSIFCMNTVMDLQIWGVDSTSIADDVVAALNALEKEWAAESDSSALTALNRGEDLTAEQQTLIQKIQALQEYTGGAYNPRLYAVIELWGFHTDEYNVPAQWELDAALEETLWDLSPVLKGVAGDRCAEILTRQGASHALLNFGGNILTFGDRPDGSPWKIGIRSPRNSGTVGTIRVTGTTHIVTSGDYQQFFERDGTRYCHIIDPTTGCPVQNDLASVTVICDDGLTANALSTALFVMGLEQATEFWREHRDFEAVFITDTGAVLATGGADLIDCRYEVISYEN